MGHVRSSRGKFAVQPASADTNTSANTIGRRRALMWVVYLEMGVALVLAVLIVWWTWPKNPPK
jgi:hypothetical protein